MGEEAMQHGSFNANDRRQPDRHGDTLTGGIAILTRAGQNNHQVRTVSPLCVSAAYPRSLGEPDVSTYSWIVCGLAAFDVFVVGLVFLLLRSQRFMDRKGRMATAIGLSGFVFHAIVFFEGAILYLQLATLAVIYIALALCPTKRQSTDSARSVDPRP